jgi:REP element-mobilizing transposase RayT
MAKRRPVQSILPLPNTHGGRRRGSGRKPKGTEPMHSHTPRPFHDRENPLHITLHVVDDIPNLRRRSLFEPIRDAIAKSSRDDGSFSIVHFSVQYNHVHLIVEAKDQRSVARGMQGFAIRVAKAINRALARRGTVWRDRYHAHELGTSLEVRNALRYVFGNHEKHTGIRGLDTCSSAPWFDGWKERAPSLEPSPVRAARTWKLVTGWRRYGLI